jgi:outer membrane receptor for ferrienterochelin and colicin
MPDTPTPRLRPTRTLPAAVLLAGTLAAAVGHAQMGPQEGPGESVNSGQSMREVVTSSRRSIEERFQAAGSLVVVDRQDIERMGVDTTVDVLRQLPGLQVTTGANGGIEIRMRGLDGSATRVMIDGQRSAGRAQLPIDQLPADLIERIEIVRSPSAEFSGSSGGTVNIVLRQASPQRSAMFRLTDNFAFGDHNPRLWLMRTGPIGGDAQTPSRPPWSFFMGVWLADSISGFDQELDSQSPTALTQSAARSRTERRDWMLIPRLSGRIGRDQVSLRGNISGSSSDGSYLQRLSDGSTLRSETSQTQRDSWQLGGDWTRRLSVGKLETSWSGNRQSDELLRQRASGTRYDEDRTESTWQLKSKLTGARESLLWMTGIEYENRQAHGSSLDSAPGSVGLERLQSRIERLALWGQNEWELPARTTLTLGLRGESVRLQSQVNETRSQQQLDFWQPSLHTRTSINETAQWRMNIARVTRQPSVWDLLDRAVPSQGDNSPSNPDQLGNPNLRPEVTQTFDIGVEQRLPGQGQAGLSLFMRRTGDVIATELFEQAGLWVAQRQNIGSARTVGLEGDLKRPLASGGWGRDWMLTANATVLQSRMSDGPREGMAIPGQPSYTISLGAAKPMRRTGGTFGGLSASLNGPASLSTPTLSGRERARITLDAHVGHSVPRKGFWRVGIYNLGDAPVERSRSYQDAGASIRERSKTYYAPRIFASIGAQL